MHRLAQVALIMLATIAVAPGSHAAAPGGEIVYNGAEGSMVFEPGFLEVEVGDTVTFVPTNSGHNVRSYAVPEGVETWNTPLDERATVKIERPGVYVYYCPPI